MSVASWSLVIAADPLLDQVGVLLQVRGAAGLQLGEREDPASRSPRRAAPPVDHHDVREVGQLGALLQRLGELGGVLRDQDPALGVGEDERGLLGVGLRVDRGRGGARRT